MGKKATIVRAFKKSQFRNTEGRKLGALKFAIKVLQKIIKITEIFVKHPALNFQNTSFKAQLSE